MNVKSEKIPRLLGCPFCGSDAVPRVGRLGTFIRCFNEACGARSGRFRKLRRAVLAWNNRGATTPAA